MKGRARFALVVAAVTALSGSVVSSASPASGAANVSSRTVSRAQAALDEAVRRYDAASAHLFAIEASVSAGTAELDALVARQADLQNALGERAREMYRVGHDGFLEVLVESTSFNDFLARWDALVRLGRADSTRIAEIRRAQALRSELLARLLTQQTEASRDLRALASARVQARQDLSDSRAAYSAYLDRIANRERARAAVASSQAKHSAPAVPADAMPLASPAPSSVDGPWKTAVASCYGTGSYGVHLASGFTIGPDSMIVAHKTLPFGTVVQFSYEGRTALATVADRGPFIAGRSFDLGPGIARVLGFDGVETVRYRIVGR